jgi:hypothetical protein
VRAAPKWKMAADWEGLTMGEGRKRRRWRSTMENRGGEQ